MLLKVTVETAADTFEYERVKYVERWPAMPFLRLTFEDGSETCINYDLIREFNVEQMK